MKKSIPLYIIILLALFSCVEDPSAPKTAKIPYAEHGAYILCEGIWHMDNSSLSLWLPDDQFFNSVYKNVNAPEYMGDLANHMIIHKDKALIALTSTGIIEIIGIHTAQSIKKNTTGRPIQALEISPFTRILWPI